jgi:Tfp pilus assembly protein PilN
MPYRGGVQLLPETQRRPTLASYTSGNRFFWTGIGMGAVIILVSAILSSYGANLQDRADALDGQLRQNEQQRDRDLERSLLDVKDQLQVVGGLLEAKRYWSQALDRMESMLRSSVRLDRMEANAADSTITFHATADSYTTVARQLKAFIDGDGVADISVNSVKTTANGVEFDGVLTLDANSVLIKSTPAP